MTHTSDPQSGGEVLEGVPTVVAGVVPETGDGKLLLAGMVHLHHQLARNGTQLYYSGVPAAVLQPTCGSGVVRMEDTVLKLYRNKTHYSADRINLLRKDEIDFKHSEMKKKCNTRNTGLSYVVHD